MRFNMSAKIKAFAEIATLLGEKVTGLGERAAAEKAISAVEKLRNDIGIPQRLRDIGIKQEQLRGLAEKTFGIKRILRVNPRSVTVEEIERVFQDAF
jgi:alcohol dehydrogenase class IV